MIKPILEIFRKFNLKNYKRNPANIVIIRVGSSEKWARSIYAKAEQTIDVNLRYELAISLAQKLNDPK